MKLELTAQHFRAIESVTARLSMQACMWVIVKATDQGELPVTDSGSR